MKKLATRIISAIVGIPILIFIVMKGGILLNLGVLIVSLIALNEFYKSFKKKNIAPLNHIGYIFTFLLFLLYDFYKGESFPLIFFAITIVLLIICLFNKRFTIIDISITLLGFIYIPYFLFHIILISNLANNLIIWYIFIIPWSTDTFAYFSGYFLGSRQLIPDVSPKKTIEGSIGGVCGSILVSIIFSYIFLPNFIVHSIFLALFGSILSQIGDLIASKIKRYVGIKDYGNIIPGHGGILDRFDSILITSPFIYYYFSLLLYLK